MSKKKRRSYTETERRAIVWDLIEQLAFRPKKQDTWLTAYSIRLHSLLQLQPEWIKDASFQISELNIACEYRIEGKEAYVAHLKEITNEKTIWSVHTHANSLSKATLHTAKDVDYPKKEISTHLRSDIEKVLEGMLFHPRSHAHLSDLGFATAGDHDPSCGMLKAKEIRVSSLAYNGFVFLYHLAYQLCVVSSQARQDEEKRLADLFEDAIKNKRITVNAQDLFNFTR